MPLTPEHKRILGTYYKVSDSAYRNWGPDPERLGIFAIHLGFFPKDQPDIDNRKAVRLMTEKVIEATDIHPGQRILDAGCGVGSISFPICSRFPEVQVFPINVVEQQLRTAHSHQTEVGAQNLHLSLQDYQKTGFLDNTFDRIIFCESLAHAQDKRELLQEVYRTCKVGGRIIIADVFSYTTDFTEEEKEYFTNFQDGMGVPSIALYSQLLDWLQEIGFGNIQPNNLTENMLPSAVFASEHAALRIKQERDAPSSVTLGRLAIIGIEKLMSHHKAGYYLVTAQK